ncbi:MAG: CDF family Co(II)/Ni(II) efflux transporter DmeF [Pirellulaceae bacterium]|jgi:cation diffusion facilitator family transporter|nr:CDF family Co(II)/Ni(II) efflux transporter DmeF [Pirellulaceae bacterium]
MKHDHVFGQDRKMPGEFRTLVVILITAATMVVEIAAGVVFGSMALLADGLHMASHASALAISLLAYVYARRHAHDARFCFGTGKVNSLAGFTGAVLLALFTLLMAWESIRRLLNPVEIAFNQAIGVAILGLLVNGLSVFILGGGHSDEHQHEDHEDEHDEGHPAGVPQHHHHHHDHNLRSAYLHVLADALTSVLAIFALLGGKYAGWQWLDPVMGVVGAILVARWSAGLLQTTSRVLLDHQGPEGIRNAIRRNLEELPGVTVFDLHLWQIGPGSYSLAVALIASDPREPEYYERYLPRNCGLAHTTIEVHHGPAAGKAASHN